MDTALAAAACGDSYSSVSVLKRLLISDATYLIGVIIGRPFNWQNFSWPLPCSIDKNFESECLTAFFWIDIFFKSMALCKKIYYCCFNDLKLIGDSLNYSHLLPRHERKYSSRSFAHDQTARLQEFYSFFFKWNGLHCNFQIKGRRVTNPLPCLNIWSQNLCNKYQMSCLQFCFHVWVYQIVNYCSSKFVFKSHKVIRRS